MTHTNPYVLIMLLDITQHYSSYPTSFPLLSIRHWTLLFYALWAAQSALLSLAATVFLVMHDPLVLLNYITNPLSHPCDSHGHSHYPSSIYTQVDSACISLDLISQDFCYHNLLCAIVQKPYWFLVSCLLLHCIKPKFSACSSTGSCCAVASLCDPLLSVACN